jgi:AAA domain
MSEQVWGTPITELLKRELPSKPSYDEAKRLLQTQAFLCASYGDGAASIVTWLQHYRDTTCGSSETEFANPGLERLAKMAVDHYRPKLPQNSWLSDADDFLERKLPERTPYLIDRDTGAVVLYESSLNELWAYRGQGKSIAANGRIGSLIQGEDFLRFRSPGGLRVVLVDGELPSAQLQERLDEFSGYSEGRLKIISPELMDPKEFPNLSKTEDQEQFLKQIEPFNPNVLVFDTLTRCFRFDTNDSEQWLVVNDFLVRLRGLGYCVVLVHHAGKNGTQRGRTDGDDNLDVSIKLDKPYGWQAGDGLAFKWVYEKVRHGGNLPDFEAAYHGEWRG